MRHKGMKLTIKRAQETHWFNNTDGDTETVVTVTAAYEPGVDPPLNPCPFCAGKSIDVVTSGHPLRYACKCLACGASHGSEGSLPTSKGASDETLRVVHAAFFARAIEAWNTRAA